jgi:hypothetical protein
MQAEGIDGARRLARVGRRDRRYPIRFECKVTVC